MGGERQRPAESQWTAATLAAAARALEEVEEDLDPLAASERLRCSLHGDARLAALELLESRRRARGRFALEHGGFFTRQGLEQATRKEIALARAERIARRAHGAGVAGPEWVLDATCGVGGDSLALAGCGLRVVSMDRAPTLAVCARANLERAGLCARVVVGDACERPVDAAWLALDPDRRAAGVRSLDPSRWSPSLDAALGLARRARGACIKLAPSFDPARVGDLGQGAVWSWVSHAGDLAELALWTGELAWGAPRQVLSLASDRAPAVLEGHPVAVQPLTPQSARGIRVLCDPDPALVRSGLLGLAARRHGLAPLGSQCAYLGGEHPIADPLLRCFRVLAASPADGRAVRRMLREHDVGPIAVRKRGHPLGSDELEKRWHGPGSRRGHVAVARLDQGHAVYLLGDLGPDEPRAAAGAAPSQ